MLSDKLFCKILVLKDCLELFKKMNDQIRIMFTFFFSVIASDWFLVSKSGENLIQVVNSMTWSNCSSGNLLPSYLIPDSFCQDSRLFASHLCLFAWISMLSHIALLSLYLCSLYPSPYTFFPPLIFLVLLCPKPFHHYFYPWVCFQSSFFFLFHFHFVIYLLSLGGWGVIGHFRAFFQELMDLAQSVMHSWTLHSS